MAKFSCTRRKKSHAKPPWPKHRPCCPLVDNQDSPLILDKRSQEIFKAIFAQLRELAANRNEQDRFEGLIAKRLQTFDALAGSLEEQLPEKGDAWRAQLVLSKLRLELEHSDSTAETRWKLLTTELETQAKMLRLEGAGNIASILERVPEQVEDLAQLRQRVRTYHLSNHEQWNVAAQLLEKTGPQACSSTNARRATTGRPAFSCETWRWPCC